MSGWLSRLFDTSAVPQDYTAPANQLGPLARQVMTNPVGTETTSPYASQSVGVPSGPFNPIEAMTPNGPMLGTDVDRAHALVTQGITEYAPTLLGMVGDAPGGKPPGFTAYHGSPHDFDAFDTSKIGTGEGAQAYGHGLYFAENEGVARGYRDRLAPGGDPTVIKPDAEATAKFQPAWDDLVQQHRAALGDGWRTTPESSAIMGKMDAIHQQMVDDTIARNPDALKPGKMYEVNVNADPAHFLDWDKPLSEQSAQVQQALRDNPRVAEAIKYSDNPDNPTGQQIHNAMVSIAARKGGNGDVIVGESLRDAGIPGIRYLDAGSRGAGSGTRNTVVFDPATLEIIRKYGIAGLLGGTGAVAGTQQPSQ